jgi:hypothetical protein
VACEQEATPLRVADTQAGSADSTADESETETAETETSDTKAPIARTIVIGPLTWQVETGLWYVHRDEAEPYCNVLSLGGFDDWRVPSKDELESLIDKSQWTCPLIVAPLRASTPCDWYWTGTPCGGALWSVSFGYGFGAGITSYCADDSADAAMVRCVR